MFEIGTTLREARLRRGFDLARCEADTKIRSKYLRAMEDEQFDVLPAPTYVRGFLRSYAEYLELDGQLILDEYESRFEDFADPGWDGERPAPSRRRTRAAAGERGRGERKSPEARLLWLALGGVLCVALLIWLGVGSPDNGADPVGGGDRTALTGQRPPAVVRLVGQGQGTALVVRARNARGKVVFRGRLQAGARRTYRVDRSIWIDVADPSGIRVTVDRSPRQVSASGSYLVTRRRVIPAPPVR